MPSLKAPNLKGLALDQDSGLPAVSYGLEQRDCLQSLQNESRRTQNNRVSNPNSTEPLIVSSFLRVEYEDLLLG